MASMEPIKVDEGAGVFRAAGVDKVDEGVPGFDIQVSAFISDNSYACRR